MDCLDLIVMVVRSRPRDDRPGGRGGGAGGQRYRKDGGQSAPKVDDLDAFPTLAAA